jgi:hypothetical protein
MERVPEKEYGKFFTGDCYIVYSVSHIKIIERDIMLMKARNPESSNAGIWNKSKVKKHLESLYPDGWEIKSGIH